MFIKGVIKMQEINKDFNVPIYIVDEILEYVELTAKGYSKCMKWENIKALLNCAKVNNQLTQEQVKFIIEAYCRG